MLALNFILIKVQIFLMENSSKLYMAQTHAKRSEEHTSELQSRQYLVCRLLLEKNNLHMTAPETAQRVRGAGPADADAAHLDAARVAGFSASARASARVRHWITRVP